MKKLSVILCAAVILLTGCSNSMDEQISYNHSVRVSEIEASRKEDIASYEEEIEEVDKWGISLDDVDRLAKQAIRRHENVAEYKQDYNKAIRVTDDYLEAVENGKEVENGFDYFIDKYDEACAAGIEYMKATIDIERTYNVFTQYGELTQLNKDYIRRFLTMYNPMFEDIEQSQLDMKELLTPIIQEDRKLTDEELNEVFTIYQILTDNVDLANRT